MVTFLWVRLTKQIIDKIMLIYSKFNLVSKYLSWFNGILHLNNYVIVGKFTLNLKSF